MLHLRLGENQMNMVHEEAAGPKKIQADGSIAAQTYEELSRKTGFRPGMMSLRSMKMKWTLADFMEMDNQFTFTMKRQEKGFCQKVTLDTSSCNSFQSYVAQFSYRRARMGYLYGTVGGEGDTEVKVEYIYEPPQNNMPEGFELLDDPNEDRVESLASMLGLRKVGWIFAHPPREEGFLFSSAEVIMAAVQQLEDANGFERETPFVSVKVTVDTEGQTHFEAFQVSKQCMEMMAEEALEIGENPGSCKVADSFTAVVESRAAPEVDNNFFLVAVAIEQHDSEKFVSQFPFCNREGIAQTWADVKRQLSQAGSKGFTYIDLLCDFQLLLFLTQFLDITTDLPKICLSIVDRSVPLDDGFKLIINHMAGIDG
jgi:nuclear protein localization family protein 4